MRALSFAAAVGMAMLLHACWFGQNDHDIRTWCEADSACSTGSSQSRCQNAGCTFNGSCDGRPPRCEQFDVTVCGKVPECVWFDEPSGCFGAAVRCNEIQSASVCLGARCEWTPGCMVPSCDTSDQAACEDAPGCRWQTFDKGD